MTTLNFTILEIDEIEDIKIKNNIEDNPMLLIQLFLGNIDESYIRNITKVLNKLFPSAHIIGSTTDGAISNGNSVLEHKTVLSFTQFTQTKLNSFQLDHTEIKDDYQIGKEIANYFKDDNPKVIILFADAFNTNGELLIRGISDILENTLISGGLAGKYNDLTDNSTFVISNSSISNCGVVAVALINPNLYVKHDFSFDWTPIGIKKKITSAKNNRVYTIDNMKATDFYNKYLGESVSKSLPNTGIDFPLIVEREGIKIGRAVLQKFDDGSLGFGGNIYEGEMVRFGIGNIDTILKNISNYAEDLSFDNCQSIFIYSCTARRHFLANNINIELMNLEDIAPTAGFFTFGEFYTKNILNQTSTYLILSESIKDSTIEPKLKPHKFFKEDNSIIKVLLHLTNEVSAEFNKLNSNLQVTVEEQTKSIYKQIHYEKRTNLPNRTKLLEDIKGYKDKYLIIFDVDRFSRINYFYGFRAGDTLIDNLKKYLEENIKNIGILYKLPSDEFAAIIIDTTIGIRKLVERISIDLKLMLFEYKDIEIPYTVTMGVSNILGDGISMRYADICINNARLIHKPYIFYQDIEKQNKQIIKNTTKLALNIRNAIINNKLCMHYQPIYNIKNNTINSYESLARLCISKDNMLMPDIFLPVLPDIHLSTDFVEMVIEYTFKKFSQNNKRFSINMTIDDILDEHINKFLFKQLDKYQVQNQLTIEILETIEIVESKEIVNFIAKVKKLGIKISIDDFGSGFANFEYLTKINADTLKIDGSLIKHLDTDKNSRIIVETIVSFANKLGIKTVAEYVHSKEILDIITEIGVDYAQGFYLGRPQKELLS